MEEIIDVEPVEDLKQEEDKTVPSFVELEFTLMTGEVRKLKIAMPDTSQFDFNAWFLAILDQNHGWFPLSENDRVNQSQLARVRRIA